MRAFFYRPSFFLGGLHYVFHSLHSGKAVGDETPQSKDTYAEPVSCFIYKSYTDSDTSNGEFQNIVFDFF